MKKFNTTIIKSLAEFTEILQNRIIDKNRILLFRGQSVDKALIPKIARSYYDKGREIGEQRMFDDFKLLSRSFLNKEPANSLEWLAIAQHHGLPTRFLDWTENPLTALFFSTIEIHKDEEHAVVWAISFPRDNSHFLTKVDVDPFKLKEIKFYKPANIIDRISAQMGWFSIHPYQGSGYYLRAEELNDESIRMNKLVIPKKYIEDINYRLTLFGINEYSIYQDLDSLTKYLFKKYKR